MGMAERRPVASSGREEADAAVDDERKQRRRAMSARKDKCGRAAETERRWKDKVGVGKVG